MITCGAENKAGSSLIQNKQIYQEGEKLFKEDCRACHNSNMIHDMTAPALGYVLEKRDSAWVRYHIREDSYAREDKDSISLALKERGWGGMPSFDFLEEEQVDKIIFYIEEEFKKNKNKEGG